MEIADECWEQPKRSLRRGEPKGTRCVSVFAPNASRPTRHGNSPYKPTWTRRTSAASPQANLC